MIKKISLLFVAASLLFAACDEKLGIDSKIVSEPVIEDFTPKSAPVGARISVSGQYLNNVNKAFIGDVEVEIVEKISDRLLSLKVGNDVRGGKITLENPDGKGVSSELFSCSFAVPELFSAYVPEQAELGEAILLSGKNLNSASAVIFTAEGYDKGREGTIVSQFDNEIVVKVPYVETNDARISMKYFDGSAETETSAGNAPVIKVVKYVPEFDSYTFEKTAVGKSITLTGKNLQNVESITVGDFEAIIGSSSPEQISFSIPAGDFQDGDTQVQLVAHYFAGNESKILKSDFIVYVPFVKFWEGAKTVCQGRFAESSFRSFFSPETGIAYENSAWKTSLDVVAYEHPAQWGSANTPKPGILTDEEYNSVVPYFFFSSVSGNVLQINSPANSNSQLKNFFISFEGTPSNDYRVPGDNISLPGTPILAFRYLNPNSDNEAERRLIEDVKGRKIENINESLFPIDVNNMTIAGVPASSMAGGLKSNTWCTRQTSELADEKGYNPDAVFIVTYYKNCGYSKDNPCLNVKRIGLLHITNIDWAVYNNQDYRNSEVGFNCYWQKYDYDYSKLQ